MVAYLAMRIEQRALDYAAVVSRYPQFKNDIDIILVADRYQHLITS